MKYSKILSAISLMAVLSAFTTGAKGDYSCKVNGPVKAKCLSCKAAIEKTHVCNVLSIEPLEKACKVKVRHLKACARCNVNTLPLLCN